MGAPISNDLKPVFVLAALRTAFNPQALLLLLGSLGLALVLALLASWLGRRAWPFGLAASLLVLVVSVVGYSAAGFVLNDAARHRTPRRLPETLALSLATAGRLLGTLVVFFLVGAALLLVVALVLVLGKLPGIGSLLYAFFFPVLAVLVGSAFSALAAALFLVLPAIWEGCTAVQAFAMLWAILRRQTPRVLVQLGLLAFVAIASAAIVGGAFSFGAAVVDSLSAEILGARAGLVGLGGFLLFGLFGCESCLGVETFSAALLLAAATTVPLAIVTAGGCVIFAEVTEGLNAKDEQAALERALKRCQEKALSLARRPRQARGKVAFKGGERQPADRTVRASCPSCARPVEPGDNFCGHCGHKLEGGAGDALS